MVGINDRPLTLCDPKRGADRRRRIADGVRGRVIAVLMGGDSGERDVSLRSGDGVVRALQAATEADVRAVDLDYAHLAESTASRDWDLAYIALHGGKGEDGSVQGWLECLGVPYTGPGVLGCAAAMHKPTATRVLEHAGVGVPAFIEFGPHDPPEAAAQAAIAQIGLPFVVKPVDEGSSLGVRFCHTQGDLVYAVAALQAEYGGGMACELIPEPEITVGVLHGHPLPILELKAANEFYDYHAKYTKGMTEFILPARLDPPVYAAALEAASAAASALSCAELCRVDMRVDAGGCPRVLDVNTSPGMTETSDLPAQAAHVGIDYADLVLEVLGSALVRAGLMSAEEWR